MNFVNTKKRLLNIITLDIKGMPIQAWPFHFDFINSLKSVFEDANKLFQLWWRTNGVRKSGILKVN
jgi:hypothetical protein